MDASDRTVQVTIKEKAEVASNTGDLEYKVSVTSPWFRSPRNLPQVIYVPRDVGMSWKPGDQVNVVLRTTGKIKEEYDGSTPWHYRWRFVAVAPDGAQPSASPAPAAPASAPARGPKVADGLECPAFNPSADKYSGENVGYEQWHTDRRTALMQAVVAGSGDAWGAVADAMFAWLRGKHPGGAANPEEHIDTKYAIE